MAITKRWNVNMLEKSSGKSPAKCRSDDELACAALGIGMKRQERHQALLSFR
ncbi:hypothetical protein HPT27_08550 [Permianibacter sp. IMCC34836]|uniref:hypothetical protein n=1 Tax=Permianibacter fluminis TaxID=2738515 RepID=UPI0015517FC6|nr:hypothetical protein [Permianibacter fluminis]NQD37072.1 hypothetical protein [Permianibacter fluminis]